MTDVHKATTTTVPCDCCGRAAPRFRASQEWGICLDCTDAGCTSARDGDGTMIRGSRCPLKVAVARRTPCHYCVGSETFEVNAAGRCVACDGTREHPTGDDPHEDGEGWDGKGCGVCAVKFLHERGDGGMWNDNLPNMGPGDSITEIHEGHTFVITATNKTGSTSGRTRYRVECTTCTEVVHEGSTSADAQIRIHLGSEK